MAIRRDNNIDSDLPKPVIPKPVTTPVIVLNPPKEVVVATNKPADDKSYLDKLKEYGKARTASDKKQAEDKATIAKLVENGRILTNIGAYAGYMKRNPDKVTDLKARCDKGIWVGAFEGDSVGNGQLKFLGQVFDFNSLGV